MHYTATLQGEACNELPIADAVLALPAMKSDTDTQGQAVA